MKKSLLFVAFLFFSVALFAQEKSEGVKGVHPYKTDENKEVAQEFAHWSLIPHGGFNAFDGDFTAEQKFSVAVPSAGLALEYNFTPVWSLGIEYMYSMYTVTGDPNYGMTADTLLYGHMHRAGGYLSMDVINLFFPRAKKKIVSIIPYVGGGVAFYKRAKYYKDDRYFDDERGVVVNPTHSRGNTKNYINADGEFAPDYDEKYNMVGFLQAGVNVEFNLNRTLAIGIRGGYTYFTRDYVDGRGYHKLSASSYASKNNDGIFDVTANLRIKFEAVKKTHVRNISSFETWENKMQQFEQQVAHDTVIIRHDSIIEREIITTHTTTELATENESNIYYVYFASGKSNLDNDALITIQQVADRLTEDPELYAVITGYCDNTGSSQANLALGTKRADNVQDELLEEYGISSDHMYAQGLGKIIGRRSQSAYSPNRRVQIRLVDKDTFDRLKANLDEERAIKENEAAAEAASSKDKTIPLEQSARKEKVNQYKGRANTEVITEQSTTLAKLARQYYNNTYCWVYIYIANKEKINNPNKLVPGISLTIPELTEKEMQITKDEGLVIYNNARGNR